MNPINQSIPSNIRSIQYKKGAEVHRQLVGFRIGLAIACALTCLLAIYDMSLMSHHPNWYSMRLFGGAVAILTGIISGIIYCKCGPIKVLSNESG